jgi:ribosomal protein S18 acetylase RimI-like enzyme
LARIDKTLKFKEGHLELMSDERSDDLVTFLNEHFHPDETLAKSIGLVLDEEMDIIIKKWFSDNLSIILISDKTGEIIACRTIVIGKKGVSIDLSQINNEKTVKIVEFVRYKRDEMDVYKRFNVDTAIDFVALGTHRDYRRQGIATKMFQAGLMFCKEIGFDTVCIKGEGTSNYSQRIYEKFNFETIHTFKYDEYKIDGEVVFKNTGEHKAMKVYCIKL